MRTHSQILRYRFLYLSLLSCFAFFPNETLAQSNVKTLSNLNQAQLDRTIDRALQKKEAIPLDVTVEVSRDRPIFSLKMLETDKDIGWQARSGLTTEQFQSLNTENSERKYGLKSHVQYTIKGKEFHIAIWHFDNNYKPPKDGGIFGESPKPVPKPLGKIWDLKQQIPVKGKQVPAFAPIDRLMADFVKSNQIPGLSMAISYQGKNVYARGFGYSNIETKTALDPSQPMRLCELSRPVTAAAIMQLVEDKKIRLDQPVFEYLESKPFAPEGETPELGDERIADITIGHMLQFTMGHNDSTINPFVNPRTIAKTLGVKPPLTHEQIISYMISLPLDFEPGEKQSLTNFPYMVLGRVIEKASNMTYQEYVQKNIFRPLKLRSLELGKSLVSDRNSKEPKYYNRSGIFATQIASKENSNQWVQLPDGGISMKQIDSAAGLIGTPSDYLTFASNVRTLNKSPILSPKAINMIFTPPKGISEKRDNKNYFRSCGWSNEIYSSGRITCYTFGSNHGSSNLIMMRYDGFSWVCLCNADEVKNGDDVNTALSRKIFAAIDEVKKNMGIK